MEKSECKEIVELLSVTWDKPIDNNTLLYGHEGSGSTSQISHMKKRRAQSKSLDLLAENGCHAQASFEFSS